MKVVAMETSTAMSGLALMEDDVLLEEMVASTGGRHSMRLLVELDRMLSGNDLGPRDVDLYVVSSGPGSFTGLRVGLSTIKGLAYAAGKNAIGVSSLKTLAWPWRGMDCLVGALLDARKGEVYAALYRASGGNLEQVLPEMVVSPARWGELMASAILKQGQMDAGGIGEGCDLAACDAGGRSCLVLIGDGVPLVEHEMEGCIKSALGGVSPLVAGRESWVPRPSVTAAVGLHEYLTGSSADCVTLDANYIRPHEAELARQKREAAAAAAAAAACASTSAAAASSATASSQCANLQCPATAAETAADTAPTMMGKGTVP